MTAGQFSIDTTSFLSIESIFDGGKPLDIAAAPIGASIFDMILNAREINLLIGSNTLNSDGEPHLVSTRLADSYLHLDSLAKKFPKSGLTVEIASFINDQYTNEDSVVDSCVGEFLNLIDNSQNFFLERLSSWKESNSHDIVGGFAELWRNDQLFTMPKITLEESVHFQRLMKNHFQWEDYDWAFCIDFIMKFRNYVYNSKGNYIGHDLRSLDGARILDLANAISCTSLVPKPLNLSLSLHTSVRNLIERQHFNSYQELLERAFQIREEIRRKVGLENLLHPNSAKAQEIKTEVFSICNEFLPVALKPYSIDQIVKAPAKAIALCAPVFFGATLIPNEYVMYTLQGLAAGETIMAFGRAGFGALCTSGQNILAKIGNKYFSPTGIGIECDLIDKHSRKIRKTLNANQTELVYGGVSDTRGIYLSKPDARKLEQLL